ncbi:MAG: putative CRISPR-associated protein [Candidatus Competibacteraceae bacterium]
MPILQPLINPMPSLITEYRAMKNNLISTVGTSLLRPNLLSLPTASGYETWLEKQPESDRPHLTQDSVITLADAFASRDLLKTAEILAQFPGSVRLCGAEINSITDLIKHQFCTEHSALFFCHSDTQDGRQVAEIMQHYYELQDNPVTLYCIEDLQDSDPKRFRTKGLRNLTKTVSRIIRERSASYCAINATGGYKAQIAIGVLMGQALGVPVYYKHELFSAIIAFPPMPISLDHQLWMQKSGVIAALDRQENMLRWADVEEDWDEKLETLVERVEIDNETYVEISPTGQIFHETFKGRFESDRDQLLPSAVPVASKVQPKLTDHSWGNARDPILALLQRITDESPYVRQCRTHYWNPNLSRSLMFRLKGEDIEGVVSNGSWTVKIIVDTSATTAGQREACVADLNHRTNSWKL